MMMIKLFHINQYKISEYKICDLFYNLNDNKNIRRKKKKKKKQQIMTFEGKNCCSQQICKI